VTLEHPDRDSLDLSAVLHALSDPQRRGIVAELAESEEPRPCGSFAPGITKSTRTHHFRVLREAGLVEQWKDGTCKMSRLRREDIDAKFPGLLDSVLPSVPVA
jgi:DNA-binding transcriptional ArsR family regulator